MNPRHAAHRTRAQQVRNVKNLLRGEWPILALHSEHQQALRVAGNLHSVRVQHNQVHNLASAVTEHPHKSVPIHQERHQETVIENSVPVEVHIRLPHPGRLWPERSAVAIRTEETIHRQSANSVSDQRHSRMNRRNGERVRLINVSA